jgi:hypothetical protein
MCNESKCCACDGLNFVIACVYCSLNNDANLIDPPEPVIENLTAEIKKVESMKNLKQIKKSIPKLNLQTSHSQSFLFRWSQTSPGPLSSGRSSPTSQQSPRSAQNTPKGRAGRKLSLELSAGSGLSLTSRSTNSLLSNSRKSSLEYGTESSSDELFK